MGTRAARLTALAGFIAATALVVSGCGPTAATPGKIYVIDTPTPPPAATAATAATATPSAEPTASPIVTPEPTPAGSAGPTASPTGVPVIAAITTVTVTDGGTSPQCGAWKVTFKKPSVAGVSGATAMNTAIAARVKAFIDDFKGQLSLGGGAGPCTLDGKFTVGLVSNTLLSVSYQVSSYLGGASVGDIVGSQSFGVADGAPIALADLFKTEAAGAAILSTQSRALLAILLGASADVSWINTGTTPFISNFAHSWVFRAAGLEIAFPQVQVASAAEGTPTILIPWAALKSALKPTGPAGPYAA
jgi:hypothetical protein